MKITVLTSRYPSPDSPYSHMFVHTRNRHYVAQGHEVQVLVPSKTSFTYEIDGVSVVAGPVSGLVSYLDRSDRVMIHLLYHRVDPVVDAGRLYDALLKLAIPTLFFIHGVETQTIWNSRRDDINWLSPKTVARFIYRDFYLIKRMINTLNAFKESSVPCKFVAPSQWMFDECMRHTKVDLSGKSLVIPNGIDTQRFVFKDLWHQRDKVLSIRPLIYKGKYAVDLLVESAAQLKSPLSVTVFGQGPDETLIKDVARQLNADRFNLVPEFISNDKIPDIHSQYGLYAAVTRMDAQGVSMCEAMASGLPVISFDTCAIPEFVKPGETGLLTPAYDVQAFSRNVESIFDDRALYDHLAQTARRAMEDIDITRTTNRELTEAI